MKKKEIVTDCEEYADARLIEQKRFQKRLKDLDSELTFQIPVDKHKIPLDKYIILRENKDYEAARKQFVKELNKYFEQKEKGNFSVDLSTYLECKRDISTLLRGLGEVAEYVAVIVHAISMVGNETNTWATILAGAGGAAITALKAKKRL